ncbi:hypothetical protein LBMAG43_19120 [Methylococcaceae bacterium]|nr:hypothetical protein LBMAG43_19120 [Methylococcaceae bacterium]
MKPAAYKDIPPEAIPTHGLNGGFVKVIAGTIQVENQIITGAIHGLSTEPLFLDVKMQAGECFTLPIPESHNAFVYAYEGSLKIGNNSLIRHAVGVFSEEKYVEIHSDKTEAAFLILAARPLNEPIVQYGPFVMNTREEIEQAIADYRNGALISK